MKVTPRKSKNQGLLREGVKIWVKIWPKLPFYPFFFFEIGGVDFKLLYYPQMRKGVKVAKTSKKNDQKELKH